jgi:hypothetical protein
MGFLFVLGTLFVALFLFFERKKKRIRVLEPKLGWVPQSADAYLEKKRLWFERHTDPIFGRPIEDSFHWWGHLEGEKPEDPQFCRYKTPFRFSSKGTVEVQTDEFPINEQREAFCWLISNMTAIQAAIPEILLISDTSQAHLFGIHTKEEAAVAFQPQSISKIVFKGINPVTWTIVFDAGIVAQDVYGSIHGVGATIIGAQLYM